MVKLNTIKLGSLFDGIAGFPLSASKFGIKAVWASEIEPFPIKVSSYHFPDMKHLGDITQISGAEIEPVDIITFGSPCQDLSVAGKRAGLDGERSGLFLEAIRIINEMREATYGHYPRFAIWENVPGAFSSNKGQDFRAVLQAFTESEIPMPRSGKWATAGMVRANGVDIAWRVLDAQYHGVPQRRRRIFLVADFRGQCASEILFKPEGLRGDSQESRKARQEVAATAGDGIEEPNCLTPWDVQSRRIHDVNGKWPSLYGGEGGGHGYVAQCVTTGTGRRYDPETETLIPIALSGDKIRTLAARADSSPCVDRGQDVVFVPIHPEISGTLCASGAGMNRPAGQGNETDMIIAFAQNQRDEVRDLNDKAGALAAEPGMKQQTFVAAIDCINYKEIEGRSGCLCAKQQGYSLNYQNPVRIGYAVRRLTPLECERLQGLPDGWTNIPGASDTARYKAIGNGMAKPCVDYVIGGIAEVLKRS